MAKINNDLKISIIDLWPKETNCQICWKLHCIDEYLPFYEDKIVDPEKIDKWMDINSSLFIF